MEWVKGSHGRRLIEWSQGLRAQLLGTDDAPTDDDLVAEADRAETVVDVPRKTWRALLIARCTVEVLAVAEHGARALVDALNGWGVPVWLDARGRASPPVLRIRGLSAA